MSMSTEAAAGDVTPAAAEQQEYFTSTFANLNPDEQLRLLRAKISELERTQTTTSSFDLLSEQNEMSDVGGTLGDDGQIDGQFCERLSKMQLEELKRYIGCQKNEYSELQAKVSKMEQEQQQLFLICPQNGWNSADCHPDLFVIPRDCLMVYRHGVGSYKESVSVRAKFAVPRHHCGIFFFELKIEKMAERCRFGLLPMAASLSGKGEEFWFKSDGTFWGHNVHGCDFSERFPWVNNSENKFAVGDVVGCGLNLATRQIIYTRNGERLDTADFFVHLSDLCPFVALKDAGDRVRANFGPNFMYDLKKEYLEV